MKNVIFIKNYRIFNGNMQNLYNPNKYNFFLIANNASIKQFEADNEAKYFKETHTTEDFSFSSLLSIVEQIADKYSQNQTTIVTTRDQVVDVCGQLKQYLGIEPRNSDRFVDKVIMKQSLEGSSIVLPNYLVFNKKRFSEKKNKYIEEILTKLHLPIFIKPTALASSINTYKCLNRQQLLAYCAEISKDLNAEYELDEFIEGELYHCDSFIKNSKILYTQVCKYSYPCHKFKEHKPVASLMLTKESEEYAALKNYAELALKAMIPPVHGITHMEIFKTKENNLTFLEVAARPTGSLMPKAYMKSFGINIDEAHVLLNIDDEYKPEIKQQNYAAIWVYPTYKGTVKNIIKPKIKCDHEIQWHIQPGDNLSDAKNILAKAVSVVLWDRDYSKVEQDFKYLENFIPYEIIK